SLQRADGPLPDAKATGAARPGKRQAVGRSPRAAPAHTTEEPQPVASAGASPHKEVFLMGTEYTNLSPETRFIIAREKAIEPMMHTPEFELLGPPDGGVLAVLCFTRACTSLSDEEATARINLLPPMGDRGRWVLLTEPGNGGPVPCASRPDTHRHLMWEVYT